MIVVGGGGRRGCGAVGCLPIVLIAVAVTLLVLVLTGGNVFFFAI